MARTIKYFSALWDCAHCGKKDIFAYNPEIEERIEHCPGCGAPTPAPLEGRGIEGNPYKTPEEGQFEQLFSEMVKEEAINGKLAWMCESCGSMNSSLNVHCTSCGYGVEGDAPP